MPKVQKPNGDAVLPRKLRSCVDTIHTTLDGGPDVFLASRQTSEETSRQCLASLYLLASSLHTPQLPYYSKSLETSRKRHVTVEQIWGQMNMLLRPVLRRLQDNVRLAQKKFNGTAAQQREGTTLEKKQQESKKRSRDEDLEGDEKDVLSTKTSELSEGDLDEEIAQLLEEQQRRREQKKSGKKDANGDNSWRYAFGKGNEDEDDEAELDGKSGEDEMEDDVDDDNDDDGEARIRRRHARAMASMEEDEDEDEDKRGDEELEALKEMYGEDFEPGDEDEDEGVNGSDEDPQLEEDLAWDDPSATFDERDGQYWGTDDMLADHDTTEDYPHAGTKAIANATGDAAVDEEEAAALNDPNLTELERERLRERLLVSRLEQQRLYSTEWTMGGEVSGRERPRDALLDAPLDFEHAMKAVPVITEAVTAKLEDRIRRRVLDGNYDDVQRRSALSAPADLTSAARRDNNADSEKSRLSLMDLYEKEYLARVRAAEEADSSANNNASAEPLTEIEKDELRAIHMWKRLAQHLDALSNFHYTPKPVQEDLSARVRAVEGHAPAITVETVGNFATTREMALAPQDLYRGSNRKYADVGSNELLPRERRALRHAKKEQVGAARDRREKRVEKAKKMKQQQKEQQNSLTA
ncbi:putative U3 small nucleolar ribonucleo protein MPP10 [Trypanosoma theileri]|uniref:Putative U3 small nucleolar ribonucleo protein MPP10 n=1 Tax=Trypanosoma theileri TaxID=67003 RepID=A0A1X0NZM8_9TRYP|nr:putative U3 small nucleolar ribonucleo protein MPP10 [Trypanosoma theileri]ORC90132.1 putative U3 small nucleolar ribonucleo protein MPP10 [Trypanosoma theileri]